MWVIGNVNHLSITRVHVEKRNNKRENLGDVDAKWGYKR